MLIAGLPQGVFFSVKMATRGDVAHCGTWTGVRPNMSLKHAKVIFQTATQSKLLQTSIDEFWDVSFRSENKIVKSNASQGLYPRSTKISMPREMILVKDQLAAIPDLFGQVLGNKNEKVSSIPSYNSHG